jgi:hypothetical protein
MAGNKDFVGFVQLHCALSSQKFTAKQDAQWLFRLAESGASILNRGE